MPAAPEVAPVAPPAPEGEEGAAPKKAAPPAPRKNGLLEVVYAVKGVHVDVQVAVDQVVRAAQIIDGAGMTLEAITGVDWITDKELEVVYDYSFTGGECFRVVVRTRIPRDQPNIPTISKVFPGANWHERETFDFFGINFEGHPQLEYLLLPEDCDFHPLLKDFKGC
ncbi:MAG: NADH-quinone oxidoreductase subunit C [Proteobacteria bacterium]|nr:NADH-quinone oxidoreductase subunit C [Pseudomonadota bacterium]MBU1639100.1 NADH-quinone oxidoreductase subunit C [Pseudomonadota bacterium]